MTLAPLLAAYASDRADELIRATRDRRGGSTLKNLRAYLHAYAQGLCVVCEQPTILAQGEDNSAEIGHLIPASIYSASAERAGYLPGNLAVMCKCCNSSAKDFPFHLHLDKIRADLVPTEWPIDIGQKKYIPRSEHSQNAWNERRRKGLPF
jgi:hypothetical protein